MRKPINDINYSPEECQRSEEIMEGAGQTVEEADLSSARTANVASER